MSEPDTHEHDYEFVAEGQYVGTRPGYIYDEYYCRRCLQRVAVRRDGDDARRGEKTVNPDPKWFRRTVQR